MEKIISKVRTQSTDMILACVQKTVKMKDQEHRMVTAALIEVYSEREGLEAADALMDMLGM